MNVLLRIDVLDGNVISFRNFQYALSGGLIDAFEESYRVNLEAESISGQLAPHTVKFNYQSGSFLPYSFTIPFFSGRDSARGPLLSGRQIKNEVEALAALAKPEFKPPTFIVPPLCRLVYGNMMSMRGFFTEAVIRPKGAFDKDGLPTIVDVSLVFERHLSSRFQRATSEMGLPQATSNGFRLFGG